MKDHTTRRFVVCLISAVTMLSCIPPATADSSFEQFWADAQKEKRADKSEASRHRMAWWRDALKSGSNALEIKVTYLLINRMIGDEFLPEDSDRNGNGTLKEWPQWVLDGKPSPTGRFTFASWRLWKKEGPLQESGLLGPVTLRTGAAVSVK
jgi:hypothetical protein